MLYLGADHGGFALKEFLKERLQQAQIAFEDCGAFVLEPNDDYPQYAKAVAQRVLLQQENKGILCCRSGAGMVIAANRLPGVRAVEAWNTESAKRARQHNDANIVSLAGDWVSPDAAWEIVQAFLSESFSQEERHHRRVNQLG